MNFRVYSLLFLLGIAPVILVASFQHTPGYMDADYYFSGGLRLAEGYGFTEDILWNYLDDPAGIPHPSHAYWMPLASIISWFGISLMRLGEFSSARLGFILIAGCIAPMTARLAFSITHDIRQAILAGILAAIPGLYLSYMGTTDTFGLSMFLGAAWLQVAYELNKSTHSKYLTIIGFPILLGMITGVFHLSRADGISWLLVGGVALTSCIGKQEESATGQSPAGSRIKLLFIRFVIFFIGYLLIMGPWFARNLNAFDTLLSPGGERSLWLTDYDELFIYPASMLSPTRWFSSGWGAILQARWYAMGQNLQSAFAVQGEIFLTPLILLGLWMWRQDVRIRLGLLAWIITFGVMSVIFPYAGWRGGFFHSGAAIQPLFWAVAPSGLESFIAWGKRIRRWDPIQARQVFSIGLVALAILVCVLAVRNRVIGANGEQPIWNEGRETYRKLETALQSSGATPGEIVLVNNAPGYYIANLRPALSIPDGSVLTTIEVAHRYGAKYLLLEENHPQGLSELYSSPGDHGRLLYLTTFEGTHIFEIQQ